MGFAVASCGGSDPPAAPAAPVVAPAVSMDFRASAGFFAAPFPSEHRRRAGGGWRLDDLPNPRNSDYLQGIAALAQDADGFATTAGVFVTTTRPIDPASLPDLAASVRPGASVFITTASGADAGRTRYPVRVSVRAGDSPTGAANMLAAVPLQGAPLAPATLHAMVVTRGVRDATGAALTVSPAIVALRNGSTPTGMEPAAAALYREALEALGRGGVDLDQVAGIAVFRTGDPTRSFRSVLAHATASAPMRVTAPPVMREVFDDYCVYEAALAVTSWQQGAAPYLTDGGRWSVSSEGVPQNGHEEPSRLVVTVPRRAMPAGGFPVVVFVRTGGGGDRPLVERGAQAMNGGPAITPGSGPAMEFAREGFAGASWDGPHGGARNVSRGDEQFLMFNVSNLGALRDNVRQSAVEAAQLTRLLDTLRIDVSACPGATAPGSVARIDPAVMALMGHSMGASIAPLAVAFEPRYRALILSGAGGSWIENVLHKQHPVAVRPFAEALLRYNGAGFSLAEDDPSLSLLQWSLEAADVPVFASRVTTQTADASPRHVLMLQGIVDHYILPPIANAASLSLGLDLAGAPLDASTASLVMYDPIERVLPLRGLTSHTGAVTGNREVMGARFTQVVRQYREDGLEDGHEVAFQTAAPKRDYRCFLRGLARGAPSVPAADATDCAP